MQMSDEEAREARAPMEAANYIKKSPKKAKMCSHPLIGKWVMHNLE